MEGKLLFGLILLIPDSNQKTNLTNSHHHKVQQKDHFGTKNLGQQKDCFGTEGVYF